MSITPGERFGPYELVSRIGAGGMGEVWRARDTRLERNVAVKLLPSDIKSSPEMRVRFAREAKAISQLAHPHICTLFDIGDDYLVMELLDGESLATRLKRGALPLSDVVRYGVQIADALDRAHRAGIVHRDVKPHNIMITKSGAKLLDFGLAKSLPVHGDHSTAEQRLTETGMVVGTMQYMAPEQLEGKDVDARADIFALGDVLYEMATGQAPFQGQSRGSQIAAILTGEPPPMLSLQPRTPAALEHLILKCLHKDPEERWQSARDVATELRWIGENAASGSGIVARGPLRQSREPWWIAALAVVLALAAWLTWRELRPRPRAESITSEITTEGNSGLQYYVSGPPALSPDGKWLVYAAADPSGKVMLWLRSMETGTTRPIAGTADARGPFWSPDSRFIGFSQGNAVNRIPVDGGTVDKMITNSNSYGWTWGRDDVLLFSAGSRIARIPAAGGTPVVVLTAKSVGAADVSRPSFLPDGNHFVFLATGEELARRGRTGIWLAALNGREGPRFLTPSNTNGVYVEPGFLLFGHEGVLRAQRFDARALRVSGEPVTVAPVSSYFGMAMFTASQSGLLVYQTAGLPQVSELLLKNRKGEVLRKLSEPAFWFAPRTAPDGRRVAVDRSDESARGDIWILDIGETGGATRFSLDERNESTPVWSSRGDEIAYGMILDVLDERSSGGAVMRKRVGEGNPRVVAQSTTSALATSDWSSDGAHLAVTRRQITENTGSDVTVLEIDSGKWIDIAATLGNEADAVFSPNGRWIAYASNESGRSEIYVQPFPPTGAKEQISSSGGQWPRWPRDGEILFIDAANRIAAVSVETTPQFRVGPPQTLFSLEASALLTQYDVTPDGNFVINSLMRQSPPMKLVTNWPARLQN